MQKIKDFYDAMQTVNRIKRDLKRFYRFYRTEYEGRDFLTNALFKALNRFKVEMVKKYSITIEQ